MRHIILTLLTAVSLVLLNGAAMASEECTLIIDYESEAVIYEEGNCKERHPPQSTFKIPLALMGFDSDILIDAHNPVWKFEKNFTLNRPQDNADTDPMRWEKESVVWFSQKLTGHLGEEDFKSYVEEFKYGNRDVSGDHGKNNGLTHSWLSSSLKISPVEQVYFIRGILKEKFDLSPHAYEMTRAIIPQFQAGEWLVHGKTGTGFEKNRNGSLNRDRQHGWFVGWAEKGGRKILFAKFITDIEKQKTYAGPRARDEFLQEFPSILKHATIKAMRKLNQ